MEWKELVDRLGGEIEQTGGGCDAYLIPDGPDAYYLITATDDPTTPEGPDRGLIGGYYCDRPDGSEFEGTATEVAEWLFKRLTF